MGGMKSLVVDRDDKVEPESEEEASDKVCRVEWGDPTPFDP